MSKKVVLGLSGGMDSATLVGYYLEQGAEVYPVIFNYQSKHNKYENEAALKLCDYWGIKKPEIIHLDFVNKLFKSNLLQSGGDIPEGHYAAENMSLTVVPGRNLIFLSIMMGYAWSIEAEIVAFGAHYGDAAIYEDCRASFVDSMNKAIIEGSGNRVRLEAPFLKIMKEDILRLGYSFKNVTIPYELTRSCYKDQEFSCMRCGTCVERLEAFEKLGIPDPIQYQQ